MILLLSDPNKTSGRSIICCDVERLEKEKLDVPKSIFVRGFRHPNYVTDRIVPEAGRLVAYSIFPRAHLIEQRRNSNNL